MFDDDYRDGRQCVYYPEHLRNLFFKEILEHPDAEFGFLYGNSSRTSATQNSVFVRYFAKFSYPLKETDELPDLRTKANGERTGTSSLFFVDSLPQDYVDEWVDTLEESGQ